MDLSKAHNPARIRKFTRDDTDTISHSVSAYEDVDKVLNLYRHTLAMLERQYRRKGMALHKKAAKILKSEQQWINTGGRLGDIPGIAIGDKFLCRTELVIIGLHQRFHHGIDYVEQDGINLATCIVMSGEYDNRRESSDTVIYSGHGGNPSFQQKKCHDQKLHGGNLALKNSMEKRTPVRLIQKEPFNSSKAFTIRAICQTEISDYFVYEGLFMVETYWQERGPHGKLVYKFQLQRIPGRCERLLMHDISRGEEMMPIHVMNIVDNKRPPLFTYAAKISTRKKVNQLRLRGCNCADGCSDSEDCSCKSKNGGDFPYDYNECVVKQMPFIYECGPPCQCFTSCINRVSQRGIWLQLEVFRTSSSRWGLRSRSFIPSGSFVCEYVGVIIQGKEARKRIDKGENLFNLGYNCDDHNSRDKCVMTKPQLSSSCDGIDDLIIDASRFGNVGRFVCHNRSPNLYAQKVLYDHDDHRLPHIMFFAKRDILPFRQLTCDYNLSSLRL